MVCAWLATVALKTVYGKRNGFEPEISAVLMDDSAEHTPRL